MKSSPTQGIRVNHRQHGAVLLGALAAILIAISMGAPGIVKGQEAQATAGGAREISTELQRVVFRAGKGLSHVYPYVHSASRSFLRSDPANNTTEARNPPKAANPFYFRHKFGEREVVLMVDTPDLKQGTLWAVVDGSGDFANAVKVTVDNQIKEREDVAQFPFPPIALPGTSDPFGNPIEFSVDANWNREDKEDSVFMLIGPAAGLDGRVTTEDGEYHIVLVDKDCDGDIEPTFKLPPEGQYRSRSREAYDLLAVDLDASEDFDYRLEICPLMQMLGIKNRYYDVVGPGKTSRLVLRPVSPSCGEFATGCPWLEMLVLSDGCAHALLANEKGAWQLPPGNYSVFGYQLVSRDDNGVSTLVGSEPSRIMKNFPIRPGETTGIKAGPPLKPNFSFAKYSDEKDKLHIGLRVAGQDGETYAAGAEKRTKAEATQTYSRREPEPAFTMTSESGEQLLSTTFEYG